MYMYAVEKYSIHFLYKVTLYYIQCNIDGAIVEAMQD